MDLVKRLFVVLALITFPSGAMAYNLNSDGSMTLQGRLTTQAQIRTNSTVGTNLKINEWDLVSQKNTLMLEYRWNIGQIASSGIASSIYVQPRVYYDGAWDYGARAMSDANYRHRRGYFNDKDVDRYKFKPDLFTGYIDFSGYNSFLRMGKQAFSWGEMSTVRILDGVCPLNTQGPGVAMEERLIPLAMVRANHSMIGVGPFSSVSVEGYFVPGAVDNTVNEGSPYGGPVSITPDTARPAIGAAFFNENKHRDDRWGIKLGVTWDDLNVNLAYYRMLSDSPGTVTSILTNPYTFRAGTTSLGYYLPYLLSGAQTNIYYLPVDVFGGSFNYNYSPFDVVIRGEGALFKDVPLTACDQRRGGSSNELLSNRNNNGNPYYYKSDVMKLGIGIDKNFNWKWLNPDNQVRFTFEQIYTNILSMNSFAVYGWADPHGPTYFGGLGQAAMLYQRNGYIGPTSWINRPRLKMDQTSFQSVLVLGSDYYSGKVKPSFTGIADWVTDSFMLIPSVTFTNNTWWDVRLQYTCTLADNYRGLGMTKDRSEFNLTMNFYF